MVALEIDFEAIDEGEWFPYRNSYLDQETGKIVFDELPPDFNPDLNPKVRVRSMKPFLQEQLSNRKKVAEFVLNHKTNSMERISYFKESSPDEERKRKDDLYDYIITGLVGFKNKRTSEVIECTREDKLKLMVIPVFERFIDKCLKTIEETEIKRVAAIEKKLIEWAEWLDEYGPQCSNCKETYASRQPSENPPCNTCRVELFEENQDAGNIFSICQGQVITAGMGEVVDISIPAINDAMDIFHIRNKQECLMKVLNLFRKRQKNRRLNNAS